MQNNTSTITSKTVFLSFIFKSITLTSLSLTVSVSSLVSKLPVASTRSCVYAAGSQTIVDWPSAPVSRGVKYSGASEPAHGFSTACSFYVLNRPFVIYWSEYEDSASLVMFLFCSVLFVLLTFFMDGFNYFAVKALCCLRSVM